ncbi:MAG: hypothetical protein IT303_08125 [Dehalococcoidia bacterium]|nr:hypothetical protein [Dehalococcoidia bacterium]
MKRPPRSLIGILALWDTTWKAIAVWKAVRNGQRRWVMPLLIVNSAGLLPIAYLAFFQRQDGDDGDDAGD